MKDLHFKLLQSGLENKLGKLVPTSGLQVPRLQYSTTYCIILNKICKTVKCMYVCVCVDAGCIVYM